MDSMNQKRPDSDVQMFLDNWEVRKELAITLLKSGFLPSAYKTPEQVIAIMLKGEELGIPVMEALNGINVVSGKPTVSPQLMLALVRRSKELEDLKIEYTNDACVVTVKRKGQSPHTTRFGEKEARALNLFGRENYNRQPKTMYQWRALAANLRITFPDVIGGLYTPEEMGADVTVTDDGNQVLVNPETGEIPLNVQLEGNPAGIDYEEQHGQSEPIEVQGTTFRTFDPANESLTFGKYAGVRWNEVPEDYLNWLKGNITNKEILAKVNATLMWRSLGEKQSNKEQENVVNDMFPQETVQAKEPESPEPAENPMPQFDLLAASLDSVAMRNNTEELKQWADENRKSIDHLSGKERASLRKSYLKALDNARAAAKKEA